MSIKIKLPHKRWYRWGLPAQIIESCIFLLVPLYILFFFYRAVGCPLGFQRQRLCLVSPAPLLLRCHKGKCGRGLVRTGLSQVGTFPAFSWSSQGCELGNITLLAEKVSLKNQNEHQRTARVSVCLLPRERCSVCVQKNTPALVCNGSLQDNPKLTAQMED